MAIQHLVLAQGTLSESNAEEYQSVRNKKIYVVMNPLVRYLSTFPRTVELTVVSSSAPSHAALDVIDKVEVFVCH